MNTDLSLVQKILLAFQVLLRWEALVTLGAFLFVWIVLRSIANPDAPKSRPIKFQHRVKRAHVPVVKSEAEENEEEDESPRSRRKALMDEEEEEELIE